MPIPRLTIADVAGSVTSSTCSLASENEPAANISALATYTAGLDRSDIFEVVIVGVLPYGGAYIKILMRCIYGPPASTADDQTYATDSERPATGGT